MSSKNLEQEMQDLLWSLPEQKTGVLNIIGGNSQNFAAIVKTAEFCSKLPLKEIRTILPDALKSKLPPLPDLIFTKSTTSGSFDKSPELDAALNSADAALLAGDFSKNSATTVALATAIKTTIEKAAKTEAAEKAAAINPLILARDALDVLTPEAETLVRHQNLTIIASLSQLQKFLRALYYPKMLLLSMPIQPVKEILHKFTLTYPCTILTFHEGQILVASAGSVETLPLSKSPYTPLTLWSTELPAKLAALQTWHPAHPLACTLLAASVSELTAVH